MVAYIKSKTSRSGEDDRSMDSRAVDGGRKKIGLTKTAARLFAAAVFLGWLMIWTVMPTSTYRNEWLPQLRAETNSTYIGRQGTSILIYTFPILFVAVIGCVYLHLMKNSSGATECRSSTRMVAILKRPVLVNWPLGIVSGTEFAFCLMFLALLIWFFSMNLVIGLGNLHASSGEELWKEKLERTALRLALVGDFCAAFLFFPVARCSSILPMIGLTSESSIRYHVWLGHITMAVFSGHGLCFLFYWVVSNQIDEVLKWDNTGVANVAGEIALLAGLAMWATTFPRIRRRMFELFYYTHHLYIVFLFFYLMHVGIAHFTMVLPGVYLFMVDRCLRFLQSRSTARLVSARLLPSEAVELSFAKNPDLVFEPLSTIFINIPSVSLLQWHPLTVTSSSNLEPESLSVIIKKEGGWTQKLYRTLASPNSQERLQVSVEGPYGPVSKNFLRYESLVLVSGGSGITPFISILRELIYLRSILKKPTPAVFLICAFKTSADLTMLDFLLPISGNVSELTRLDLRVEAFVTRERPHSGDAAQKKSIQTLWFKPLASDAPIAPVLGPNGWLWLAAVLSSSCVVFLLLIGIVQRYFIYPIDKNTDKIYSSASRSTLNFLFLCISIAAAASVATLMNKNQSSKEAKQVQNFEAQTPTTSPSSWLYNTDRELESLPLESLVKATKVHFDGRPPLKKMLLEYEGANVGVMASGPRGMRREVASICSSELANNLHFESISFSW